MVREERGMLSVWLTCILRLYTSCSNMCSWGNKMLSSWDWSVFHIMKPLNVLMVRLRQKSGTRVESLLIHNTCLLFRMVSDWFSPRPHIEIIGGIVTNKLTVAFF